VNEDVLCAVIRLDEAKALLVVEPLHGAHCHSHFLSIDDALRGTNAHCCAHHPGWSILEKYLKRARPWK
jgi:hypothetical protein